MIEVGDIVCTNYDTGPYRVVAIKAGCRCPAPLDTINMRKPKPSAPHFHLTCVKADCPVGKEPRKGETMAGYYALNGYARRGSAWVNIWRPKDRIFVKGHANGVQLSLFP